MVVPPMETERGKLCRQCGGGYMVSSQAARAVALPAHSLAELIRWLRARRLFGGGT